MIRVDSKFVNLEPDQQSFDLRISNTTEGKVFFKVGSTLSIDQEQ